MAYRLILAFLGLLWAFPAHADEFRGVKIAPEDGVDYNRERDYGGWIDDDGDGINTRHEVLIEDSLAPVQMSTDGKSVESGLWFDPYTAKTFILPRDGGKTLIDIDHMVPLKEAHQSGAYKWTKKKRSDYANDLDNPGHLIAVDSSANRSKSDKDPAKWMPPNTGFHCAYVMDWLGVKRKWNLTMDQAEADKVKEVLAGCE